MTVVSISFAGDRPCVNCGSTSSVRGWSSSTDEVSCASESACAKRRKPMVYHFLGGGTFLRFESKGLRIIKVAKFHPPCGASAKGGSDSWEGTSCKKCLSMKKNYRYFDYQIEVGQ